jgi:hypothetical protein
MDPGRLLACNACSPTAVSLAGFSHPAKNDHPNASINAIESLIHHDLNLDNRIKFSRGAGKSPSPALARASEKHPL